MPDFLLVTDDGPVIVDVHRWAQLQWPTLGECLLITPDPTIVQWGEITASWQSGLTGAVQMGANATTFLASYLQCLLESESLDASFRVALAPKDFPSQALCPTDLLSSTIPQLS